mgnify:CR=1 FL=1
MSLDGCPGDEPGGQEVSGPEPGNCLQAIVLHSQAKHDPLVTVGIDDGPQAAAVAAFREGVRLLTGEPVVRRFLQLDGEFTATTEMLGEARLFLVSAATAMARALRAAGASMPDDDLMAVAEVHIRLAASLVQVATPALDVTDDDAVTRYAWTFLAPMVI